MVGKSREFEEWLTHGPGEEAFGSSIKDAASKEKRRLRKRLSAPNLFPHIEHEDRAALNRAERLRQRGETMRRRGHNRNTVVASLLHPPEPDHE